MTLEKLRSLHSARPFRPFALRTTDGRSFEVPHSEFLAYDPEGTIAILFRTDGTFSMLDLPLVTELEVLPTPKKKSGKSK